MKLPKSMTTVTTFSKYLALSMLVVFPILAFFFGRWYEQQLLKLSTPPTCYSQGIHPL